MGRPVHKNLLGCLTIGGIVVVIIGREERTVDEPVELMIKEAVLAMKRVEQPENYEPPREYRPQWRRKEKHRKRQWV